MLYYSQKEREKDYICRVVPEVKTNSKYLKEMSGSLFSLHTMVTLLFLFMFLLETVHGTKKVSLYWLIWCFFFHIWWFCNCVAKFPSFVTFQQPLVLQCYIVYLGAHSHGPRPTSLELEIATNSHYDLLSSTLGRYTMLDITI